MHIRADGTSPLVESPAYVDIHQRRFTEADLRWIYDRVKSPSYVVTFEEWKARHHRQVSEAYSHETTDSGMDKAGKVTAADQAKVTAVIDNKELPEFDPDGERVYVVVWADGRGIFACRRKSYLQPWLDKTGDWAEIVKICYTSPGNLKIQEDADVITEENSAVRDALVNGKAVLIDNCWWQVSNRDEKADKVALVVSKYAHADGFKNQKPKLMSLSALVSKITSGKWGANINGKRYGPEQNKEVRDKVRQKNGLSATPGAAKFRKKTDEAEDVAIAADPVATYLTLFIRAEDQTDAADLEPLVTNDHEHGDNAGIAWAATYLQWERMTAEEQAEADAYLADGRYRPLMGAPPRGVLAREIANNADDYVTLNFFDQGRTYDFPDLMEMILEGASRTHQPGVPVRLTAAREARLRKRGFTYRRNPDAPPAKKGYPPMVRKWAADEGFPLATMQRMWDMSVEDVDHGGELDRPEPGDKSRKAIRFWEETTRMFRSMVAERRRMESA